MNKIILITFLLLFIGSCGLKELSNSNAILYPKDTKELIARVNMANKIPEWIYLKGKINIVKESQQVSLTINIKSKKDSIILGSISAPLGIELFRIQILQDSIYFVNRSNKTYFIKHIFEIRDYFSTEILFNEMYNMITANPAIIEDSYVFNTETIYSQNEAKETKPPLNSYRIISDKIQYKIDPIKYRILEARILGKNNSVLEYEFSEFQYIADYIFPYHFSLKIEGIENFSITVQYTNVIFDKKQKVLFKIPDHYVKIK